MWKLLLCINYIRCMPRNRCILLSFKDLLVLAHVMIVLVEQLPSISAGLISIIKHRRKQRYWQNR